MNFIFTAINSFFRLMFYPFENLTPVWGMIWISLVTGIVMLGIFRLTSNQRGIKKSKAGYKKVKSKGLCLYSGNEALQP
ncbi:MAG: hypothetical protein AMK70_03465 [Nitrospira bacterium SG8_35_1]|nr:MAG: hypothetical protein AMK70_03465 [Nitrospira bacterium SG8_35_1]